MLGLRLEGSLGPLPLALLGAVVTMVTASPIFSIAQLLQHGGSVNALMLMSWCFNRPLMMCYLCPKTCLPKRWCN